MASSVNKVLPALFVCVIALLFGASVFLPVSKDTRALACRLGIITTVESAIFVGGKYCWHHVSGTLKKSGVGLACSKAAKLFLLAILGMAQFSFLSNIVFASQANWISYTSYVCLGLLLHSGYCLLTLNAGHWVFWTIRLHMHCGAKEQRTASKFSSKVRLLVALVYGVSIGMYGLYSASLPPTVKHVEIPIKGLAPSQDGFRIVQIVDIHVGPTVSRERLVTVVDIVNGLKPGTTVHTSTQSCKCNMCSLQEMFADQCRLHLASQNSIEAICY